MELSLMSRKGLASFSCRPPSSHAGDWAPSSTAAYLTTSVLVVSPTCLLPMKSHSPSSSSYKSSIWGAPPVVRSVSKLEAVSLLLLAPGLSQKLARPAERSGCARAYMEPTNPVVKFFNKVQGALPIVGLIARLSSPEGGVGTDRIRFEEFCTRVGRNCSREASSAFYEFSYRHGKAAKIPFVLIWCWAAALGAGLLTSEDLLMGASRLSVSYDIQYEVENFDLLMDEATKKREKSGSKVPDVPIEARAEKALEAICKCCTSRTDISEEDAPLLSTILKAVFPTADEEQIDLIITSHLFNPLSADASKSAGSQIIDEQEPSDDESLRLLQEFAQ